MKKITIIILFVFGNSINTKAQTYQYIPLHLDVGTTWVDRWYDGNGNCGTDAQDVQTKVIADTFFNGYHYYKTETNTGNGNNCVVCFKKLYRYYRNDTLNKKVYQFVFSTNAENLEMDFDLNIGDTLKCPVDPFIIDTIGYSYYNGFIRKFYGSTKTYDFMTFSLVEGLGTLDGFVNQCWFGYDVGESGRLTECISFNDTIYFDKHKDSTAIKFGKCDLDISNNYDDIKEPLANKENGIAIYQTHNSFIITQSNNTLLNINVFDVMGNNLKTFQTSDNKTEVSISELPPAIYIIKIGNNKNYLIKKVVR